MVTNSNLARRKAGVGGDVGGVCVYSVVVGGGGGGLSRDGPDVVAVVSVQLAGHMVMYIMIYLQLFRRLAEPGFRSTIKNPLDSVLVISRDSHLSAFGWEFVQATVNSSLEPTTGCHRTCSLRAYC